MSNDRKPNSNSVLKTQTEDRQRVIIDFMRDHSLTATRAWLAEDGLITSETALSEFWSWWQLRQALKEAQDDTDNFLQLAKEQLPDLPQEKLDQFGAAFFQMRAIKTGDAETYLAFSTAKHKGQMDKARLDQRERELEFSKEKFEEMKRKAAERDQAEKVVESALTPEEKQRRLKAIFGLK